MRKYFSDRDLFNYGSDILSWGISAKMEDWDSLEDHLKNDLNISDEILSSDALSNQLCDGFWKYLSVLEKRLGFAIDWADSGDDYYSSMHYLDLTKLKNIRQIKQFMTRLFEIGSILDNIEYDIINRTITIPFYEIGGLKGLEYSHADDNFEKFGMPDRVNIEFYNATPALYKYLKHFSGFCLEELKDFLYRDIYTKENIKDIYLNLLLTGEVDRALSMVKKGLVSIDERLNTSGELTPLMCLAIKNNLEGVKKFVRAGADKYLVSSPFAYHKDDYEKYIASSFASIRQYYDIYDYLQQY